MSDWTRVCPLAELPPGSRRSLDVDGASVLVINAGGELFAVEDVCTHDGAPLDDGGVEGHVVVCPRHGARFCLRTGAVLAPPAYAPIATFPLRVVDGVVEVRDPRWD